MKDLCSWEWAACSLQAHWISECHYLYLQGAFAGLCIMHSQTHTPEFKWCWEHDGSLAAQGITAGKDKWGLWFTSSPWFCAATHQRCLSGIFDVFMSFSFVAWWRWMGLIFAAFRDGLMEGLCFQVFTFVTKSRIGMLMMEACFVSSDQQIHKGSSSKDVK